MRSTHAAKVGHLSAILRQGFIVEFAGRIRIEREVKLVFPAELKTRLREGIITQPGPRVPFREIGGMSGDLICNDSVLDVFLIGQTQMFFGCDVTKHGSPKPANHRGADAARYVVVSGSYVGNERS